MTFQARLRSILERGNLTVADLARWLERPHATVSTWVNDGREPTGPTLDLAMLEAHVKDIETRIARKAGFPVPPLSQPARIAYLTRLKAEPPRKSPAR